MQHFKRLTALMLAAVMVVALAGCGGRAQSKPQNNVQLQRPVVQSESAPVQTRPAPETTPAVPAETEPYDIQVVPLGTPVAEPDRDSLEQIAELVTGEDYADLTGQEAPEDFPVLLIHAEDLLHARTLQQYRRTDIPEAPLTIFKRALAMQVSFMGSRSLEGWADPAMMTAGVTLGRFSVHSGGASSAADAAREQLAPATEALLPTLMA